MSWLQFFSTLSLGNRVGLSCLLFWLSAGTVIGLGFPQFGPAVLQPFFVVTVPPGAVGALAAGTHAALCERHVRRLHRSQSAEREVLRRSAVVGMLLALANAFPLLVRLLAWGV
jgi:hypothetical protein